MGKFIAFAYENNARRLTSDDGLDWTIGASTILNNPVLLGQNPDTGRMVCVVSTGSIYYSDDEGITWNTSSYNVGSIQKFNGVRAWFQNGKFYVGNTTNNRIHKSSDGISWSPSPSHSPLVAFGPGPGSEQYGFSFNPHQWNVSTDEFNTKGPNQTVPVMVYLRRMLYLDDPAGYLFIGTGTRHWQYQNPATFGTLPNYSSSYISELAWSEVLERVFIAPYNTNQLFVGEPGLPFTEIIPGRPCHTMAEGAGAVVFSSDTGGFVRFTDLISSPQGVDPLPGTPTLALIFFGEDTRNLHAEFVAPIAEFSANMEVIEELQAEFVVPLASFETIISSTINMEAEFTAPMPSAEFVVEGNEFESLFHTALPPMPVFYANLGLPSDLYGRFFAPLPKFSAELYLPQDFSAEFAAPLPDFYSVHEVKQSLFGEFAAPMALFEAYIEDHASATIAVGFGKLQLQIITEEERNSALTFVAVT